VDIATIIGIVSGFLLVGLTIVSGGDPLTFVNVPSVMVVMGGMLASTLIHFSLKQFLSIISIVKKTVMFKLPSEQDLIQKMVNYSAINRKNGALALEQHLANAGDGFLVKGLQMIIDGQGEEDIERQLGMEIFSLQERHQDGKKILDFMGASAPAFGMIGTLIGLVQMLGNLSSPDQIGVGMATALITTFYGAILANLIFIPLAGKLGLRSKKERILREMIVEGVLGIVRGESPTAVREKMQTFLSQNNRPDVKPNI
jgi:chemotaxis protein MotA